MKTLAIAALLTAMGCAEFREPRFSQWNPKRPTDAKPGHCDSVQPFEKEDAVSKYCEPVERDPQDLP